jgi:hypothetical protein
MWGFIVKFIRVKDLIEFAFFCLKRYAESTNAKWDDAAVAWLYRLWQTSDDLITDIPEPIQRVAKKNLLTIYGIHIKR